ncbi:RyR domain-containing protein [Neobacillus niacini]|uniref:RyR domain-containing protein n=1 Tax=Neobacillus niacini TaxID=86668 RepID=UPI0021CAF203|nr:RyR domain-containing protein [Neobacillus niacini]MCM3763749.1 RyR domain-containing protein [Neobacillus niacini]
MTYNPKPIDTSMIDLPKEILELREILAKNVHEVWAAQRIQQGWTHGEYRDDQKKTHPNLVPYEELTEEDKDYDRNTMMETLKAILSLGYTIK